MCAPPLRVPYHFFQHHPSLSKHAHPSCKVKDAYLLLLPRVPVPALGGEALATPTKAKDLRERVFEMMPNSRRMRKKSR